MEANKLNKILEDQDVLELTKIINDKDIISSINLAKYLVSIYMNEKDVDIEFFKLLLENNVDINIQDNDGSTALIYASIINDFVIVQLLINNGADINIQDNDGITALMNIADNENTKIAKLLIDNNANLDIKDKEGSTALMHATQESNNDFVKVLLNNGADINIQNNKGNTALMLASSMRNTDIVKLLMENGANIEKKDKDGFTPFHIAVIFKFFKLAKLLLDNGADINTTSIKSNTILMDSIVDKDFCYKLIKDASIDNELKGQYLKSINNYSKTDLNIIEFLLENNADVNIRNNAGLNAYNIAEIINNPIVMKLLRSKDSNTIKSNTILISFKNILAKSLITLFSPVKSTRNAIWNKDNNLFLSLFGFTYSKSFTEIKKINFKELFFEDLKRPLGETFTDAYDMISSMQNTIKDMRKPRKRDISVIQKFTPIIDLIKKNESLEILKKAIKSRKNDLDEKDKEGKTALHYAVEQNNEDIVILLMNNGADIEIENKDSKTILQIANVDMKKIVLDTFDLVKNDHNPKALVKILINFTKDEPMKFTTHEWDLNFLKNNEFKNINGYLSAVKNQWNTIKEDLEMLSPNLYKKVNCFLWETDPSIAIGWLSMDGLKQWCDDGNDPDDFKNFKEIITTLKKVIEVRKDTMLEDIFIQERKKLKKIFKENGKKAIINFLKLKGQTFYTDTEKFNNAIKNIFSQMSEIERLKYPNITIEVIGDSTNEFIELKITQIDSVSQSNAKVMLEEITSGNFASIKGNLTNLCDWSIESSFEDNNYRVNYLKSNHNKNIEELDYKPLGFTHILRFYNK